MFELGHIARFVYEPMHTKTNSPPFQNQRKVMRALYSSVSLTTSNLPYCHHLPLSTLSLKSPFLVLSPHVQLQLQFTSLHKNSNPTLKQSQRPIIAESMASSPSIAGTGTETETKPFSVLFVCLGNICRSPAAEGVFRDLVNKKGFDSKFFIDSAGTINYHEGNEADPRMRAAAKRRGIQITSLSRPIRPSDFKEFDLILAMDKQNKEDILGALERWSFRETLPADAHKKVRLMCSYCKRHDETEVPDPYYGGPQGFEKVLDMLEDVCESLLESILAENN